MQGWISAIYNVQNDAYFHSILCTSISEAHLTQTIYKFKIFSLALFALKKIQNIHIYEMQWWNTFEYRYYLKTGGGNFNFPSEYLNTMQHVFLEEEMLNI